jgi:hypothetical protein
MEPKLFVATKAFIIRDGKVLIVRESLRYDEGANADKFDVPGGLSGRANDLAIVYCVK